MILKRRISRIRMNNISIRTKAAQGCTPRCYITPFQGCKVFKMIKYFLPIICSLFSLYSFGQQDVQCKRRAAPRTVILRPSRAMNDIAVYFGIISFDYAKSDSAFLTGPRIGKA